MRAQLGILLAYGYWGWALLTLAGAVPNIVMAYLVSRATRLSKDRCLIYLARLIRSPWRCDMRSMTRQYSTAASQASDAAERAAGFWDQGVGKLADRFSVLVPQLDLVPAVERYFDFVQRAVAMNRMIAVEWAQAVGALSGAARKRAESAGEIVRERAESAGDVVRERAESFEQAASEQAEKAEQAQEELAREARRIERQKARQAHEKARARYEGLTKAELSELLAERDLPKSGNVDELVERLVEADGR